MTLAKKKRYDLINYRAPVFRSAMAILNGGPQSEIHVTQFIDQQGAERFIEFLHQNDLACIFHTYLSEQTNQSPALESVREALRPFAIAGAAKYLSQKRTLKKIHEVLEDASITYAVFKGSHVRECVYEQAWLRTTADIDVLVSKKDHSAAIDALKNSGMEYHHNPEVFSHEVTLTNSDTSVDLHWHIMRPGRTRIDMTDNLLENTTFTHGYRGMNSTATLFVLLTHPAINKYVCSPDASLIKLVDLSLWMKHPEVDRGQLLALINASGLRTAAWSTLFLLYLLTNGRDNKELIEELQPGILQRKYIQYWVSRDLPTRFYKHRFLMRAAFSLSLHDTVADIFRAVKELRAYRLEAGHY
ncbi:MAG: nucleotidyltransferase family protein [Halioglobus sp.]